MVSITLITFYKNLFNFLKISFFKKKKKKKLIAWSEPERNRVQPKESRDSHSIL